MSPKKNISLIAGISIPVLMIVLVAVSIYVPALFAPKPRVNFLYMMGDDYYGGQQYVVKEGTVIKQDIKYPERYKPGVVRFFLHDSLANQDKELSFEEVQNFKLDANVISIDGYEVVYGNSENSGYGFFPFFFSGSGTDYNAMYLKGHGASRKLNLQSSNDARYSFCNRRFLGWIR